MQTDKQVWGGGLCPPSGETLRYTFGNRAEVVGSTMKERLLKGFFKLDTVSGVMLLSAALLAMILVNSSLSHLYASILDMPISVRIGNLEVSKPFLLWVNNGLMTLFFLLIGMEIKLEVLEGQLSSPSKVILPGLGALGGIVVPAIIYVLFNYRDPVALTGWAVPTATDIAFAMGFLSLFGNRVPHGLKVFLMTLAVLDDLGAVVIIALFYIADLSFTALALAAGLILILVLMNRLHVQSLAPYILVGMLLWLSVLQSGVHSTLSGLVIAFAIPLRPTLPERRSLLRELVHDLHPAVALGILPIFAFANAGISLEGIGLPQLSGSVPMGITLGLFVGKQTGVFCFCWIGVRMGLTRLPSGITWPNLYGTALLCGVGFTMSIFIGSLAFEYAGEGYTSIDRLGIITGTLLSGIMGLIILHQTLPKHNHDAVVYDVQPTV